MIPIYCSIYYFRTRNISRINANGQRRSLIATVAYRAGDRLYDEANERWWNFERNRAQKVVPVVARAPYRAADHLQNDFPEKKGVAHSEISCADWIPEKFRNRQTLWNAVEASEMRHDARLAKEITLGLPRIFTVEQNLPLVRDFVQRELVPKGIIADWSMHTNPNNIYADILMSTRYVAPEHYELPKNATHEIKHAFKYGFLHKNRIFNFLKVLIDWREQWAAITNEHLAEAGYALKPAARRDCPAKPRANH